MVNIEIIDKLNKNKTLDECEWEKLISDYTKEDYEYSSSIARKIAKEKFSNKLYLRGIVEFSNICKNDCLYCGIKMKFWNVVISAMSLVTGHLFFKAVKTHILLMKFCAIL